MKKLKELMPERKEIEAILQVATIWIAEDQQNALKSKHKKGIQQTYLVHYSNVHYHNISIIHNCMISFQL